MAVYLGDIKVGQVIVEANFHEWRGIYGYNPGDKVADSKKAEELGFTEQKQVPEKTVGQKLADRHGYGQEDAPLGDPNAPQGLPKDYSAPIPPPEPIKDQYVDSPPDTGPVQSTPTGGQPPTHDPVPGWAPPAKLKSD